MLVPAIVYYEIRRELLRAKKASGLARLDAFVEADPYRYLTLTDSALRLAAGYGRKAAGKVDRQQILRSSMSI